MILTKEVKKLLSLTAAEIVRRNPGDDIDEIDVESACDFLYDTIVSILEGTDEDNLINKIVDVDDEWELQDALDEDDIDHTFSDEDYLERFEEEYD